MLDVDVIDDPAAATAALDPVRCKLLHALAEPGSATSLASRFGLPRQNVNYHLRTLESHGLVRLVDMRPRRGLTERVLLATAASYVVSPAALGDIAADPDRAADALSARYLIALAGRIIRELGQLVRGADGAGKRLATLSIDTRVRFRSAADRAAFATDLAAAVTALAARYHAAPDARAGRDYRLILAAYPLP